MSKSPANSLLEIRITIVRPANTTSDQVLILCRVAFATSVGWTARSVLLRSVKLEGRKKTMLSQVS